MTESFSAGFSVTTIETQLSLFALWCDPFKLTRHDMKVSKQIIFILKLASNLLRSYDE